MFNDPDTLKSPFDYYQEFMPPKVDTRLNAELVLDYVNSLRATFNLGAPLPELPPDYFEFEGSVSENCPMTVALGTTSANASGITLRDNDGKDGQYVVFPKFVREFVKDHDDRRATAQHDVLAARQQVREFESQHGSLPATIWLSN